MTNQAATDSLPYEISALLIPMRGRPWLLPNVMVAEIVPLSALTPCRANQQPLIGWLMWREQQVPVLSFEQLNNSSAASNANASAAKLMVLHSNVDQFPFFAVIAQGVPRLAKLGRDDVEQEPVGTNLAEAMQVLVNGELAVIPDLDMIDRQLQQLTPL